MKKSADIKKIKGIAKKIRQNIAKMLIKAQSPDLSASLEMADIFCALYFGNVMLHNPKRPNMNDRDRVILSYWHACPALYATLAEAGYFPKPELWSFQKPGGILQANPAHKSIPGVESASGISGQGLSVAAGIAYAVEYFEKSNKMAYCLSSGAEQEQGQTWEAAIFGAKYKLPNLTMIISRNNIKIGAEDNDLLKDKYKAFDWRVIEVDGHNIAQIISALAQARETRLGPVCIIANTISGKGVKFMESSPEWLSRELNKEEAEEAFRSLGIKSMPAKFLCGD